MVDMNNNKVIRKIFGTGKDWRIFWRFNEQGSGFWHKLKFTFVLHRVPFVLVIATPALFGLGFASFESGGGLSILAGDNFIKAFFWQLLTFSFMFSVVIFNEWYGTQKGYDKIYDGQIVSGGTRLIVDNILPDSYVLRWAEAWFIIGIISFAFTWILTGFNLILLIIFIYGCFSLVAHDWFKAHDHFNLLGYFGMTVATSHGMYVALTGNFPPLGLWVLSMVELLWVYEKAGFVDLADWRTDKLTGKKTVYVQKGVNRGWFEYRTLAMIGSMIFILAILTELFPIWFLFRLLFWFFDQPIWALVSRHDRERLNEKIELPFVLIVILTHIYWFIWVLLLILL